MLGLWALHSHYAYQKGPQRVIALHFPERSYTAQQLNMWSMKKANYVSPYNFLMVPTNSIGSFFTWGADSRPEKLVLHAIVKTVPT